MASCGAGNRVLTPNLEGRPCMARPLLPTDLLWWPCGPSFPESLAFVLPQKPFMLLSPRPEPLPSLTLLRPTQPSELCLCPPSVVLFHFPCLFSATFQRRTVKCSCGTGMTSVQHPRQLHTVQVPSGFCQHCWKLKRTVAHYRCMYTTLPPGPDCSG